MGILKANSSLVNANKVSVKKTNLGGGKLSLSKFDARNISNIALWTKQGSLTYTIDYVPFRLSFTDGSGGPVIYNGGDIDVNYNLLDPASAYYEGEQFGFYISYNETYGVWYLFDNNDTDIAEAENLFGPWTVYGGLGNFYLEDYDVDSYSEYNPIQYTWSDISGKNNHLVTRKNPVIYQGVTSSTINGLETKIVYSPFKTTDTINAFLPFTIYIVFLDGYTGVDTRKILGMNYILYLESTSFSGTYHTFALKYYPSGFLTTICSFNVRKSIFSSTTFGPGILKISSAYRTNAFSPIRNVTLSYYNFYNNINKTLGSLSANGTASFAQNSSAGNLYLPNNNLGYYNYGFQLSEVLIYNKSLSAEEDDSINRYLQRKYYGKTLS